jgi:N-methylhydantoinase B
MTRLVDPVAFEVMWHKLLDITEEMGIKYMRTSGSPVLVGAYDASTGITLPDGTLVAMGPYITTQAHVLRLIVDGVRTQRAETPGIAPGDMFICNDPFLGATHQPDVATVAPVHAGDELVAWVGASGHWLDIGGSEPGGFNMTATSVFDEGLRLPPTRIVEGGTVREDLVDLIMAQLREPLAELELRGQIVANATGRERILELCDSAGTDVVGQVMRAGIAHVASSLRERLRAIPDGVWREVQYLDHDGHSHEVRKIVVTVTKRGDRLGFDFTGSDPQTEGFANCARGGLRAAVMSGVCIALGYDMAWNDGIAECVTITAPPRTIVTAEYPYPVSMSTISAIIVTLNLILVALSRMLLTSPRHHEQAMASWCGTSLGVSMSGVNRDGILTVAPEASHFAAGCGARTYADGVDTGGIIINTTANIPSIEETEDAYPLLYLFRRQLADSGGPGRFRGGVSAEVAITPHGAPDGLVTSFAGVGSVTPNAVGVAGGLPGATVRYLRFGDDDIATRGLPLAGTLASIPGRRHAQEINSPKVPFRPGTVEYHNWQGGGGAGDPLDREPWRVRDDVIRGLVSRDAAAAVYGVVLADDEVDTEGTTARRDAERAARLERARPYREEFPLEMPESTDAAGSAGSARYWDLYEIDAVADETRCLRCSHVLASASEDVRGGCVAEEVLPTEAGPVRGEDYRDLATPAPLLRRLYCAGCGRQLECDLVLPGGIGPSSRLASAAASAGRAS